MKTPNSVSLKILILTKINKKVYFKKNVRLLKSMFISMHSILGWASFCMNYCIGAAWHGGNQLVALLRCNGRPGCFDSSLQVICIVGLVSLIFLLTKSHRFSMEFRSGEFDGQSSTPPVIEPAFGTFGSVDRCRVLLENEISISIKLVSRT